MKSLSKIIITFIALVAIVGGVFAYQNNGMDSNINSMNQLSHQRGEFHDNMEKILENGTYNDLVKFREEVGFNIMPFVSSQADFDSQKDRHEEMKAQGFDGDSNRMNSQGHRGNYGHCMMDDDDNENNENNDNSEKTFDYDHGYGRGMMG